MANTPNLNLYLPSRDDSTLEVDTTLSSNFTLIDTAVKNIQDQLGDAATLNGTPPSETEITASEGQTLFTVPEYTPGTGQVEVYVDGVPQFAGEGFAETTSTTITLAESVSVGTVIRVITQQYSQSLVDQLSNMNHAIGAIIDADNTGGTDATTTFQSALDKGGRIIVPSGTYLVGSLTIPSYAELIGVGSVTLKHNISTGYVASGWNRAMITNANIPVYADPASTNRPNAVGNNTNIRIENITFDGNNQAVQGALMVAVDNFYMKNVTFQNMSGATTYFVGMRYSKIVDCISQNCSGDCFAMTDKHLGGKRGFSTDVIFENCLVQNCGSVPSVSDPIPSMFELSDGMSNITFLNCKAINNNGCGFDIHIHANLTSTTSDWDMKNINFINCRSENNTMSTVTDPGVSGFVIGQCPSNSAFRNINLINCTSIGSQTAFATQEGSQTGYREDITIVGGHFENTFTSGGTINTNNAVIYIGKSVRRFKINNANLYGATDSYGFYSYGTNDGVKISNVSVTNCYIPLGLTHTGGRVEINNLAFTVTNPSSALSSICLAIECDDVTINGIVGSLDQSKYSSSIVRFIGVKKGSVTGLEIENTGALGNNAIQLDTVGYVTLTGNVIKNFTNGVFFSNTSTSVVSVGNIFKTCTSKYNTTPAYLVDAGNAV